MTPHDELLERLVAERFAGEDEPRSDPAAAAAAQSRLLSELIAVLAELLLEDEVRTRARFGRRHLRVVA